MPFLGQVPHAKLTEQVPSDYFYTGLSWLNLEPADEDKNEEKLDANTQELEEVEEDLGGITLSAGKKICHHFFLVKHFCQPNFVTFVNTVTNVR